MIMIFTDICSIVQEAAFKFKILFPCNWRFKKQKKNYFSCRTDGVDEQLELLVLIFVVVLGVLVQNGDVDAAQDDLQVEAGWTRKGVLDLKK